ncbi:MAG: AMP-binding protein [Candidatus Jordarchaeaceae archaeon]
MSKKITYSEKPWMKIYDILGLQSKFEYPKIPLFELIDRSARDYPNSLAAVYLGREYTYKDLKSFTDRLATALVELGVKKGDVVGVNFWNSPQFIIGVYGSLKTGATVSLFNPLLPLPDLKYGLQKSGAKVIITQDVKLDEISSIKKETKLEHIIITSLKDYSADEEPEVRDEKGSIQLRNLINETEPNPPKIEVNPTEDVALLFFTGGTTGVPKGVMLTHYNLTTNVIQTFGPTAGIILDVYRGDFSVLGAIPFSHIYGFTCSMNLALNWAGNLLLVPDPRDSNMIYQLIKKYHPLFAPAVPTQFMRLAETKDVDLNELKGSIPFSGSAALPPEVSKTYEKRAEILVSEGYGLSETSPVTHVNFVTILKGVGIDIDLPAKLGSIGVPVPDTEVRIVDIETGTEDVPVGEPGEMIIRGPQVMKGYWPNPGDGLVDGWVYTGDICKMDEDGYFYVVDRVKDMINVSGYKVYGRVVDDVLYEHPAVSRAAAIGVPDPKRPGSERVKVFIRVREGYTPSKELEEDIIRHCRERLPPYAVPKFVEFRDDLPLTATEKIFKRKLREEEIKKQKAASQTA